MYNVQNMQSFVLRTCYNSSFVILQVNLNAHGSAEILDVKRSDTPKEVSTSKIQVGHIVHTCSVPHVQDLQ